MQKNANKHEGDVRQFTVLSQAWYGPANLSPEQRQRGEDRINIGFHSPDGGTSGEFYIEWSPLVDDMLSPKLSAFDDSWSALAHFSDFLQKLAELDGTNPTVAQVIEALKSCGVEDATVRVSPYGIDLTSVVDKIENLAAVASVYQQALNSLRNLCREKSGDPFWGALTEHHSTFPTPVPGISTELYRDTVACITTTRSARCALTDALRKHGDRTLAEKYKDLSYITPDDKDFNL